jgi:hypothetical protein
MMMVVILEHAKTPLRKDAVLQHASQVWLLDIALENKQEGGKCEFHRNR